MLGNFSIGDYFKAQAIRYAWELSLQVFGFQAEHIWVTVFAGDESLGLGPDEEAIELWRDVGVPRERIVACPRSENFWEAGPVGPSGPCSELYVDRGLVLRHARGSARRRERAVPGVLEPRVHAVRPGSDASAAVAAGQQHRHRPRPQPPGRDPAGQGLGVRHRPVPAADRARPGALRPRWRRGRPVGRPRAAHPRRPCPRHVVSDRRRRRPVQRGSRLCPAPAHPPRDPAGPAA